MEWVGGGWGGWRCVCGGGVGGGKDLIRLDWWVLVLQYMSVSG